jgi:Eco57I restriction-modification methylase
VSALGGMLFGTGTTPLLDRMRWGERAVARLLDALLWTPAAGRAERERVHYGALDVEDPGRVYEALLELEPGIAAEPMCRLRRAKLEVVLPAAQGAAYRGGAPADDTLADDENDEAEGIEDEAPRAGATRVRFVEDIPAGRFYLRVSLGRKASGSYYTPDAFVRFLVQETLGPQVAERSPHADPQPARILDIKVLDPAMGSGHFLVEACRVLGLALYEACRLCDERALEAEEQAARAKDDAERESLLALAAELRRRVERLPDPNDELVAYLPSRAPEGEASGLSENKARALCRRLVAVHCLYGVDKNPLAVELAKLSLWLESYAEGLPLTFLDHRLVCGDALTGPFFEYLLTWPSSGKPVQGLFEQGLAERLTAALNGAVARVRDLEASVGKDLPDIERKRSAKAELDAALAPFKLLASAWSGGVMLGESGDDAAYADLARAVTEGRDTEAVLSEHSRLRDMVETGREGVPFDLVFPEVFHAGGVARSGGFHAVLGNPPWDALQPLAKEFFAAFDLRIIDAPTRRERAAVERRLTADPTVQAAYGQYAASFDRAKSLLGRVYRQVGGRPSGAVLDIWQGFAERGARLLQQSGGVGWVLPSAFHANQSATGIRQLYLDEMALRCCYSFENRKKLFDIDSRFKFAVIVAENEPGGTEEFDCAFYLHDLDWLFPPRAPLRYVRDFVRRTARGYLSLLELRSPADVLVAGQAYRDAEPMERVFARLGIRTGEEIHMSKGSHRFTPTAALLPGGEDPRDPEVAADLRKRGYLPLHEGKTFHQYDDHWEERPRYCVALDALADKPDWPRASQYYRLAFRDIASSTNERTGIFCLLPPGVIFGNKAPCEREPHSRSTAGVLTVLTVVNCFVFDFMLRTKVQATVNLFILNGCPYPGLGPTEEQFLAHAALRLTCNHAGYAALYREQVGEAWREPTPPQTWPILAGEDTRWAVRATVDAVVAKAYGLSREQYGHVLASFSHSS